MNESRFIELLNLYVDHQLSPAEASELESEIRKNPARRRTYQQYCRMQKACAQLFELERSSAPSSAALPREQVDVERKVIAFPAPASKRGYWLGLSAAAAAACVVFVTVFNTEPAGGPSGEATVATVSPAPSSTPTVAVAASFVPGQDALAAKPLETFTPVFIKPVSADSQAERVSFVSMKLEPASFELDWTRQIKLEPVRKVAADEVLFSRTVAGETLRATGFQTTATAATEDNATEQAAFQFQK